MTENSYPYASGRLVTFPICGRAAYVVEPTQSVDSERRWVWFAPDWMALQIHVNTTWPGHTVEHDYYVQGLLEKGFHLAGVDVGRSCGSPAGAEVNQAFYEHVTKVLGLSSRARLLAQSNGGLIHYAWATRHPECVERILGLYPVCDMRSWPGLEKVCGEEKITDPGLGYEMTPAELEARLTEFNPVERVVPLVQHQVKMLHLHGDADELVPLEPNSGEFVRRVQALGGDIELLVMHGVGHNRDAKLYESEEALAFLLA
jgi:hypothetical protein